MPAIASLEYEREKPVDFRQPEEKERVMSNMNNAKRSARLSSYAMAAVVVPVSSADVIHNTLDQSFELSFGQSPDVLQLTGVTLSVGTYTISFSFNWYSASRILISEEGGGRCHGALKTDSNGDVAIYGYGQTVGMRYHTTGDVLENNAESAGMDLPSELGFFYIGFEMKRKSQTWFGFMAIELLSSYELRIDHWGYQTDMGRSITTTLPSTGDPVPGIGGIAALALGASGVRRSRRRLI